MLVFLIICAVLYPMVNGKFQPEPKVVGGRYINITEVPHSVSLQVKCMQKNNIEMYCQCGSSIVNQLLLLTAAHCANFCGENSYFLAYVGSINKVSPNVYSAVSYLIHNDYDHKTFANDIALIRMKTDIKFSPAVARVALMKNPSYTEKALLAGWGYIDEVKSISGNELKAVEQLVWKTADCNNILKPKPEGILCASSPNTQEYPSKGDSGSALIIRGYIQIGLVSFKRLHRDVICYSDTGYYYDWIKQATNFIFCGHPDGRVF